MNIKAWILEGMAEFDITAAQVLACSVDSAANITRAVDDLIDEITESAQEFISSTDVEEDDCIVITEKSLSVLEPDNPYFELAESELIPEMLKTAIRISCVAHQFQLSMTGFMWKDDEVKTLLNDAMNLAKKLRTPIVRYKLSCEKRLMATLNQITRWTSTFSMTQRLLELKDFCQDNEDEKDFKILKFDENKWKSLEELNKVLAEAASLTTKLQSDKLLVNDFVYEWLDAATKIEEFGTIYSTKLKVWIDKRQKKVMDNTIVLAAWYLDNHINVMLDGEQKEKARQVIAMVSIKMKSLLNIPDIGNGEVTESLTPETQTCTEEMSPLERSLAAAAAVAASTKVSTSIQTPSQRRSALELEMKLFDSLPRSTKRINAIQWWQDHSETFPLLEGIALVILAVPVTEVSVERLFSHLNFVIGKHRSSLSGTLLEDILFLRFNNIVDPE